MLTGECCGGMNSMNSKIRNKKIIFFDLFFILISTFTDKESKPHECDVLDVDREIWDRVSVEQYYKRGIGIINEPYKIVKDMIDQIKPDMAHEKIVKATATRIERFRRTVVDVSPEILDVLRELKEQKYILCLISNADVIDIMGWDESPLGEYFDEVIFSCLVGMVKPDIKIYQYAMDKLSVQPADCIFVGDGGSDELMGAKKLGISTVLTKQYRNKLWPETVHDLELYSDYSIGHLKELIGLMVG
jgi:putative hydrolase of the HAD superfamily